MTRQLSTHTLWKSADKLDPFTFAFFETLVGKAGLYIREQQGATLRTFSLHLGAATFAPLTPYSDATRAREDSAGEAFEGTHELSPLDRQRESAGMTNAEGEES